jgi:DNA-directed RNA polymerase subunit RPC12/RpoP
VTPGRDPETGETTMTTVKFKCPTCLRQVHRPEVSDHATGVRDLRCPRCGAQWRFVITPTAHRESVITVHTITNTVKLS